MIQAMGFAGAHRRLSIGLLVLGMLSAGGPRMAAAQSASIPRAGIEQFAEPGITLGAKLGLGTGAPINDFGLTYGLEIEFGYLLPLPAPVFHALELFAGAGLTRASLSGETTGADARIAGDGAAAFEVDERTLPLSFGVRGRIPLASPLLAPYLGLGYRGAAVWDTTRTRLGEREPGEYTERKFVHGLFVSAGVELYLGPGACIAELQLAWAARSAYVLRDAAVGGTRLYLGYRFIFSRRKQPVPRVVTELPSEAPQPAEEPEPAPAPAPAEEPAATEPAEGEAEAGESQQGQIRGNVRSFAGAPLRASVLVQPGDLHAETSGGRFTLQVAPGRYTVNLQADGYAPQTRSIVVDEDGITVLNVELREK